MLKQESLLTITMYHKEHKTISELKYLIFIELCRIRKTQNETKKINSHYDIAFFSLVNFLSSVVEDTPLHFNALPPDNLLCLI